MKNFVLLILMVLPISLLHSQVGINISNPQGVFQIDPKGDTSTGGTTDDFLITADGRVGIGTVSPQGQVHLKSDGTLPIMRISDGSEKVINTDGSYNKLLRSNEDGAGSWVDTSVSTGVVYQMSITNANIIPFNQNVYTTVNFNKRSDAVATANGIITCPINGSYLFTFRWWGAADLLDKTIGVGGYQASNPNIKFQTTGAKIALYTYPGNVKVDEVTIYAACRGSNFYIPSGSTATINTGSSSNKRFGFITSLFAANVSENDRFVIKIMPLDTRWVLNENLGATPLAIYFPSVAVFNI